MTGWSARVEEPFRADDRFWTSVGASVDALICLVAASVVFILFPGWSGVAFGAPVVLMLRAWWFARASSADSKRRFETVEEWRLREREAVAAALPGAFVRHVRRGARAVAD